MIRELGLREMPEVMEQVQTSREHFRPAAK